tara:strand:- start:711 stop:1022 length:312 start_codon:yes stop_codon:yes gene_type:complete
MVVLRGVEAEKGERIRKAALVIGSLAGVLISAVAAQSEAEAEIKKEIVIQLVAAVIAGITAALVGDRGTAAGRILKDVGAAMAIASLGAVLALIEYQNLQPAR